MGFKVNEFVEVCGVDEVYKHAFYVCRISRINGTELEVMYENRRGLSGEAMVETVGVDQVRRIPEAVVADFDDSDFVEVWLSGGWWREVVVWEDDVSALLYFAYRQPGEQHFIYPKEQLRIHQKCYDSGKYTFWLYKRWNSGESVQPREQVEILGVDGIFKFAVFGGRVVSVGENMVQVEYDTLLNPAGGRLVERVHVSQVRSIPDVVICDFKETEFVEAWIEGGWWGGIIVGVTNDAAIVYFGYKHVGSQYILIRKTLLRIHQKWKRSGMYSMWVYRKKMM
ncbi:hypothetical protein LXL04_017068 [Taraxacum kok-saghyz]